MRASEVRNQAVSGLARPSIPMTNPTAMQATPKALATSADGGPKRDNPRRSAWGIGSSPLSCARRADRFGASLETVGLVIATGRSKERDVSIERFSHA